MVILLVVHHAFEDLVVDEVYRVGPEVQEYVVDREEATRYDLIGN